MTARRQPPVKAGKPGRNSKNPYGYAFWEWVAREDPEYFRARQPLSALSIGEGKELSVKYREMVIIGILAFRGRKEGVVAHMRRAIEHAPPSESCWRRSSPPRCRAAARRSAPAPRP